MNIVILVPKPSFPVEPDYLTYYYTAKELLSGNPAAIYDVSYLWTTYNVLPYRYFPTFVYLMIPFTVFEPYVSFVVFNFVMLIFTLLSAFYLLKIIRILSPAAADTRGTLVLMSYFLFSFVTFTPLIQGQPTFLLAFLVLLSLYYFLKGRDFLGGLLLGLSLAIKPISIFVVLFLLFPFQYRRIIKKLAGFLVFAGVILLSLLIPLGMLEGFLHITGMDVTQLFPGGHPLPVSFGGILAYAFGIPPLLVVLIITPLSFLILLWRKQRIISQVGENFNLLYSFLFGTLMMFIGQTDTWVHQIGYFFVFLLIYWVINANQVNPWFIRLGYAYSLAEPMLWIALFQPLYLVFTIPCTIVFLLFIELSARPLFPKAS